MLICGLRPKKKKSYGKTWKRQLIKLKKKMKNQVLKTTEAWLAQGSRGQERIASLLKAPLLKQISSIISQQSISHSQAMQIPEESDCSRGITCSSCGQGEPGSFTDSPTKIACSRDQQFPGRKMNFCFQTEGRHKLQTPPWEATEDTPSQDHDSIALTNSQRVSLMFPQQVTLQQRLSRGGGGGSIL